LPRCDDDTFGVATPIIAWKPVETRGHIDRASTLREVIRERREEIVRQSLIGMA
jgi:hypothetical protein